MRPIFISGIGTGIGKTIAAAVLTEALEADYWKPIQAGDLNSTDSMQIAKLISNNNSIIHQEAYALNTAASPHYSAFIDKVKIELKDLNLPNTSNQLVIEGAGGLMVPLNEQLLMIDLIKHFKASLVIVINNYLGSINHSLLSIDAAKHRNIEILGIIFNGEENKVSEEYILKYSRCKYLGTIKKLSDVNKQNIKVAAQAFTNL